MLSAGKKNSIKLCLEFLLSSQPLTVTHVRHDKESVQSFVQLFHRQAVSIHGWGLTCGDAGVSHSGPSKTPRSALVTDEYPVNGHDRPCNHDDAGST